MGISISRRKRAAVPAVYESQRDAKARLESEVESDQDQMHHQHQSTRCVVVHDPDNEAAAVMVHECNMRRPCLSMPALSMAYGIPAARGIPSLPLALLASLRMASSTAVAG